MSKLHPIFEQALAPFFPPIADRSVRMARCGCGKTEPSSNKLAFFEPCGEGSKEATETCTCGYHRVAHRPDFQHACAQFKAKGAQEFDRFYCGCRGWD
jgi:hypothetical protein